MKRLVKSLTLFYVGCALCISSMLAADNRDAAITKLKSEIPKHPTAQSPDPMVQDTVSKYRRSIAQIQVSTVSQNLAYINDELDRDIATAEKILATTKAPRPGEKTATSSMRVSAQANLRWFIQLRGYLTKFEKLK